MPPASWMFTRNGLRSGWPGTDIFCRSTITAAWFASQPEPDQDVGRDVRMLGVAGEHALQRQVILAEELGAAAGLVGDGQHAVDVRDSRACTSRNLSFTNWLTLAEQFTPEMIAT